MANPLMNIPGLGGYLAQRQMNEEQGSGALQKALTLSGLIEQQRMRQMQAQEAQRKASKLAEFEAARSALPANASMQDLLNLGLRHASEPKDVATIAERQISHSANAEATRSRLAQQWAQFEIGVDLKIRAANRDDEKLALERHKAQIKQAMDQASMRMTGERLFYDTGAKVDVPNLPPVPTQTPQSGQRTSMAAQVPQEQVIQGSSPTYADALGMFAAGGGAPRTLSYPEGTGPSFGAATQQPSPSPAPPLSAPPVQATAYPDAGNLDARDIRLRGAVPQASAPKPTNALPQMPPEIASAPPRIQNQWRLQQTRTSIAGGGVLNPETLKFVAEQYLAGDRQAIQGFARNATARIAIQNAIVEEATRRGMSPQETAAQIADFAGTMAASRTVGQRAANIQLAATEAEEMLGIVKETSDRFGRTNFVPWNVALRAYESGTGKPEIAAFGAAVNALVNVYARAINPTGQPTVSDKEHARAVLNTVQGPEQVDAVLAIIKRELEIAKKAPATVQQGMRSRVTGAGGAAPYRDPEKERRYQEWKRQQGL